MNFSSTELFLIDFGDLPANIHQKVVAAQKLTDLRPVSLEEILSSDPDPSTETVQQSEDFLDRKSVV